MKILKKITKYIVLPLLGFVLIYGLCYLILPRIDHNTDVLSKIDKENSIRIYLSNNGTHSDFIVPYNHELKDWSTSFLISHTFSKSTTVNFLKIGWGDSKIYFDVPTWDDLTVGKALSAMVGANESVVRVDYLDQVTEGKRCIALNVSPVQYKKLVDHITSSLQNNEPLIHSAILKLYGKNCAFYKGNGRLSIFNVCNTWVNRGLYNAGLPSVFWTIEHQPIFDLYIKK